MTASFKPVLVISTASSVKEANKLARALLHHRVAACVNIVPRITSWYWWQGKLEGAREILLLIKTSRHHVRQLSRILKKHHSYEVPELIAINIVWGERMYLNWLKENLNLTSRA